MKKDDGMTTGILDQYISGYHEYALDEPVHIVHVSRDLCEMLGLAEKELLNPAVNMLLPYIHPADGDRYQTFLSQMARQEKNSALECRVVTKTGEVRHVAVSMKSVREADGMRGYAALTVMAPGMEQMEKLQFMNDTIPCGLLRYSCEKLPRITFVNDTMLDIMRVQKNSQGDFDPVELYKSNIYLMIAEENRARFSQVLQEVYLQGRPHAGEVSVIRGDGSRGRLFGWVTKRQGREGKEEFQSICMDVTRRYQAKKSEQTKNYLSALSCVYDMIFEFDIPARTVCYLQGQVPFFDEYLKGVPMDFSVALNRWLKIGVPEEDQGALKEFLHSGVMEERSAENGSPGIDFSLKEKEGDRRYHGILLRTDPTRVWFCCSELKEYPQETSHRQTGKDASAPCVRIRTFGYFDVFVEDKPIMFRHEKAKELLALLVDRRGGYVSSEEAIGFLWEEEPASPLVLARYRKVSLRLKNILEEYGIADIVESVNGKRRVVTDRVECDLYQYLSQRKEYAELFGGSYLTNYSWGEITLGELMTKYTAKEDNH